MAGRLPHRPAAALWPHLAERQGVRGDVLVDATQGIKLCAAISEADPEVGGHATAPPAIWRSPNGLRCFFLTGKVALAHVRVGPPTAADTSEDSLRCNTTQPHVSGLATQQSRERQVAFSRGLDCYREGTSSFRAFRPHLHWRHQPHYPRSPVSRRQYS